MSSFKGLTTRLKRSSGRNHSGKITVYQRGGGHKRNYRKIDFSRNTKEKWIISAIEYDPNRSSDIALVVNSHGKKRYILACDNMFIGQIIEDVDISSIDQLKNGNSVDLASLPIGAFVCNIEEFPTYGGKYVRSAGTFGVVISHNDNEVSIKLPSNLIKTFDGRSRVTIGTISNSTHNQIPFGKAGAKRWIGRRPNVRGVAMNPVDHPHGGGEGKTSGGRPSVSPWGKITKHSRKK